MVQTTASVQQSLKQGLLQLKKRQFQDAVETFRSASERFPKDSSARLLYGIALSRVGESSEAISQLERAVAIAPSNVGIVEKAAKALVRIRRPYRALGLLRDFLEKYPEHVSLTDYFYNLALKVGWYQEGFAAVYRAIEQDPGGIHRRLGLARLLYNFRDYEAAAELLSPAFDGPAFPQLGEAYYLHAEILRRMERSEEAIHAIDKGLEHSERTSDRLLETAGYQLELGNLVTAEQLIEEVLRAEPDHHDALGRKADFAMWRGEWDAAKTLAEKMGSSPSARRIVAAYTLQHGEPEEAREILNTLITEDEQDSLALLWRGELKRRMKEYDSAVTDIDMGIIHAQGYTIQANICRLLTITDQQEQLCGKMDKDSYAELLRLSKPILPNPESDVLCDGNPWQVRKLMKHVFQSFQGNLTPTTTYIRSDDPDRKLQRLHIPAHSRFASRYAQELIRTRRIDEVLHYFDEMIAADPDNPIVYTHSGEIYLWLGRYEESLAEFKKSIAITPKVRWAYIGLCANELMLGRYQAALNWCKAGLKAFPPPGRTMFPYRAEVYRRMGKFELALEDMKRAQSMTPGRMTGWMNEALIYQGLGDDQYLVPAYRKVWERSPCLVETALEELGDPFVPEAPTLSGIPVLFEHMMKMMRGNRSSDFITYFTEKGDLRFVPPPEVPDFVNNV